MVIHEISTSQKELTKIEKRHFYLHSTRKRVLEEFIHCDICPYSKYKHKQIQFNKIQIICLFMQSYTRTIVYFNLLLKKMRKNPPAYTVLVLSNMYVHMYP